MSKTVQICSSSQFNTLLETSKIVIADFYADWCGPCKQVAPLFEQFSAKWSVPNKITFAKIDTEKQQELAQAYGVTALLPTFVIFKNKTPVSTIQGANPRQLLDAVQTLAGELGEGKGKGGESGEESGSGGSGWLGLDLSRGYGDVTEHVDPRGLDILNSNSECGKPAVLFEVSQPSALDGEKGKGKSKGDAEEESDKEKDWVESDTDDQLMLYIPFKAALKVQSLHITSLPPKPLGDEDEDIPMRPKTIRIYSNRAHVLGFEEAEDIPATQGIMLRPQDWDEKTGTVRIDLRFVKFQNVTSLVIFVMDGDGQGEKVRLDRLRIIGEAGEKRELGKLEKIGDLPGE